MDRLKSSRKGFTLVELVIAVALSAVVLLAASNLLIHFGKFSANVVKNEASLMGTALGSFEEIVGKITAANEVFIPAANFAGVTTLPSIDIRVGPSGQASSDHTNDIYHTYWIAGGQLYYKSAVGVHPVPAVSPAVDTPIAKDVVAANSSFVTDPTDLNRVQVTLEVQPQAASGGLPCATPPCGPKEHLVTTAIMRSRSAS